MAYPGSSGRSVDMIAVDPWHSLEQKCQETMSQASQCQRAPRCVLRPRQGSSKVGDALWTWCGFVLQTARRWCPADPWQVGTKGCIPLSPLPDGSWQGCGKYCLHRAGGSWQQERNFSFKLLLFVFNLTGCCSQLGAALQV